jgi:hypothetical protein
MRRTHASYEEEDTCVIRGGGYMRHMRRRIHVLSDTVCPSCTSERGGKGDYVKGGGGEERERVVCERMVRRRKSVNPVPIPSNPNHAPDVAERGVVSIGSARCPCSAAV